MTVRAHLLNAAYTYAQGHIDKHLANIEVLVSNPVGVADHPDIMASIESELDAVSRYHDQMHMLEIYYGVSNGKE